MVDRRAFVRALGIGGGAAGAGTLAFGSMSKPARAGGTPEGTAAALHEQIAEYAVDDTHCHPLTDADAETTPRSFLSRMSLAAFPAPAYFPDGVLERWKEGDAATRRELDRRYDIETTLAEIEYHFRESVFVKFMVKELAEFLDCAPDLESVIEARNDRGRDYWGYVNALFRDIRAENVMIDTGYSEGMDAAGIDRFEQAIAPARARRIYRVETITNELFRHDMGFDELEARFLDAVRTGLDGDGNFGKPSYGMKSYLMPAIGPVKPLHEAAPARKSWQAYRETRDVELADREAAAERGKDLRRYLLTLALEECLARDMPMQFHAGDGEAPGIILRRQDPYFLEEVVRFDRDGVMRMPRIVPIHAGYPLVSKAAWLSHLYTNCYFELSIMTPFVHRGLVERYQQVMEAVPLSKILFGSDAYHVPELYWLAGRWGKRFLSQALAVYVESGALDTEEALAAARMILHGNNRRLYGLGA